MKGKIFKNTVEISKFYMNKYVEPRDIVLDATVGNGNDTLELAKLVGNEGKVYGFDIQTEAINNTGKLLKENNILGNIELINDSHENIGDYIDQELDFIIYNLGYLPGGNKKIITKAETTVKSIKASLRLLKRNAILLVNSYVGHQGGAEENKALEGLLKGLDQRKFNVIKNEFLNQKNNPPKLYIIEKLNTK